MYLYSRPSLGSQGWQQSPLEGLGQAPTSWTDTAEQRDFRERILKVHIARSTQRKGRPHSDLPDTSLAPIPGTNIRMRPDAAIAAGNLLATANRNLIAARENGDPDALRTIRITASSGHRSRDYQTHLWRKYFTGYY